MKRLCFALCMIMIAAVAYSAPGDKRPAVTSAAIGLGTSSSATMASITATTSVTAPAYNSTAADGYHMVRPYNSTAFAGTPLVGMIQTTPTGPQWYTGSAWEAIGSGGASAITDLTDWPSGLTATELGYLDGATSNIQAQINAISVGSPVTTAPTYSDQTCTAGQYAFDASYAYFCRTANTWDRIALGGWSNPTPIAPTFSSAVLGTDGTTLTLGMSASTSVGAGGSGGIVATGSTSGELSGTYSSGAPGTSLIYTLPSSIKSGETVTLAYTQPGNGLEGAAGGADVVTVSGTNVTNNSTQSDSLTLVKYQDTHETDTSIGANSGLDFRGQRVTGADTSVKAIDVYVSSVTGTIDETYTWTIKVFNTSGIDLSGAPGSPIATSDSVAGTAINAGSWLRFTFTAPVTLTSSTAWAITGNKLADASNYINLGTTGTGDGDSGWSVQSKWYSGGLAGNTENTSYDFAYRLYQ